MQCPARGLNEIAACTFVTGSGSITTVLAALATSTITVL
ncbi:unnamed protein product, partial [Rotaria magnacalcarata]